MSILSAVRKWPLNSDIVVSDIPPETQIVPAFAGRKKPDLLCDHSAEDDDPPKLLAWRGPLVVTVLNYEYLLDSEDGLDAPNEIYNRIMNIPRHTGISIVDKEAL